MWPVIPRKLRWFLISGSAIAAFLSLQGLIGAPSQSFLGASRTAWAAIVLAEVIVIVTATMGWRSLWRVFPILNRWIYPDINGIWEGELRSNWKPPDRDTPIQPKPVVLRIRQGLFEINMDVEITDQSRSRAFVTMPSVDRRAGRYGLFYMYENTPDPLDLPTNAPHEGAGIMEIELDGAKPAVLRVRYFTNRQDQQTRGKLEVRRTSRSPDEAL